jgi:hypothetical protein
MTFPAEYGHQALRVYQPIACKMAWDRICGCFIDAHQAAIYAKYNEDKAVTVLIHASS